MRRVYASMAVVGLALSGAGIAQAAPSGGGERAAYIVRYVDGVNIGAEAAAAARGGAEVTGTVSRIFPALFATMTSAQASALDRNPRVVTVELDGVVTKSKTTQTGATWGLDRVDQRTRPLDGNYVYGPSGAGVRAYILDTGVRASHDEFTGRLATGHNVIPDGRGTDDCDGHGTHVAGTVAGSTWGVAKSATVVPVRVLDCTGSGTWSGVIAGMDWVVGSHRQGTPGVVNMSLGGGGLAAVDDAVARLTASGITVVVAAGNSSADACRYSPARAPSAITVGSTTDTDVRSSFSNFGRCLDIFAPGSSITSAWHTSNTATHTISGTSMASPHVAGAAALVLSGGYRSPEEVTSILVGSATAGVISSPGNRSPNLLLFTNPPPPEVSPTAPGVPTDVTAAPLDAAATITWKAPLDTGGSSITKYIVEVSGRPAVEVLALSLSTTVTGLTNGTAYSVTVKAVNAVGTGAASGAVGVTPVAGDGPPPAPLSAPTGVSVSPLSGGLRVSWSYSGAVPDNFEAVAWNATTGGARAGSCTAAAGVATCDITGLARNAVFYVDVSAIRGQETQTSAPRVSAKTRR